LTTRRFEIGTAGVDPASQGMTTDAWTTPRTITPTALGLYVPPVLPGDTTPDVRPRYLFCLATREISKGVTRVRGVRQGITIGYNASSVEGQLYPITMPVWLPGWHFIDGNVSWHLVKEPNTRRVMTHPNSEGASWRYTETNSPAMLFQNATFAAGATNPSTGQPLFYGQGLTTYKPPSSQGWQEIAGLGNMKSIMFPYHGRGGVVNDINEVVEGSWKISLYASVLQTNPATRLQATYPTVFVGGAGLPPEESFIATNSLARYWNVYGSILFEDEGAEVKG
jgi:hypothetical protein